MASCASCGAQLYPTDAACWRCGTAARVSGAPSVCPRCSTALRAGMVTCPSCGAFVDDVRAAAPEPDEPRTEAVDVAALWAGEDESAEGESAGASGAAGGGMAEAPHEGRVPGDGPGDDPDATGAERPSDRWASNDADADADADAGGADADAGAGGGEGDVAPFEWEAPPEPPPTAAVPAGELRWGAAPEASLPPSAEPTRAVPAWVREPVPAPSPPASSPPAPASRPPRRWLRRLGLLVLLVAVGAAGAAGALLLGGDDDEGGSAPTTSAAPSTSAPPATPAEVAAYRAEVDALLEDYQGLRTELGRFGPSAQKIEFFRDAERFEATFQQAAADRTAVADRLAALGPPPEATAAHDAIVAAVRAAAALVTEFERSGYTCYDDPTCDEIGQLAGYQAFIDRGNALNADFNRAVTQWRAAMDTLAGPAPTTTAAAPTTAAPTTAAPTPTTAG